MCTRYNARNAVMNKTKLVPISTKFKSIVYMSHISFQRINLEDKNESENCYCKLYRHYTKGSKELLLTISCQQNQKLKF